MPVKSTRPRWVTRWSIILVFAVAVVSGACSSSDGSLSPPLAVDAWIDAACQIDSDVGDEYGAAQDALDAEIDDVNPSDLTDQQRRDFFEESLRIGFVEPVERSVERLGALGSPDVPGGQEWQLAYVEAIRLHADARAALARNLIEGIENSSGDSTIVVGDDVIALFSELFADFRRTLSAPPSAVAGGIEDCDWPVP